MEGRRLSWPRQLVTYPDGLPVRKQSPIQVVAGPSVSNVLATTLSLQSGLLKKQCSSAIDLRLQPIRGLDSSDTMWPLHDLGKDFWGYVCVVAVYRYRYEYDRLSRWQRADLVDWPLCVVVSDAWSFWVFVYRVHALSPAKPIYSIATITRCR